MYKINITGKGDLNGVALGERYCLTKRTTKQLIKDFGRMHCEFRLYKFVHCGDGIFCWSEDDAMDLIEEVWYAN